MSLMLVNVNVPVAVAVADVPGPGKITSPCARHRPQNSRRSRAVEIYSAPTATDVGARPDTCRKSLH